MVIAQGDIWWAELPDPVGSGPGFRRPVVVVQGDSLNRSRIATVVCVPLTMQPQVGRGSRQPSTPDSVDGPPKGIGRERLADCELG